MDKQFYTFLLQYFHNGQWWGITIRATSKEDAQARMNTLPHAQILGKTAAVVPGAAGFAARLRCWWHNRWLRPSTRG